MTFEWSVTRQTPEGDTILGTLETHGGAMCYTLENATTAIPEGRYPVTLTVSERAKRGELWAPGSDFNLPLLSDVPNRTGIRLHSGNVAHDSVGCILLGSEIVGTSLNHSRPALIRIVNILAEAERDHDLVFLTVHSLKTPEWAKGADHGTH